MYFTSKHQRVHWKRYSYAGNSVINIKAGLYEDFFIRIQKTEAFERHIITLLQLTPLQILKDYSLG